MAISGGVKFFNDNFIRQSDSNVSIVASTGQSSASFCLDRNRSTYWRSVGSDDSTTETLEITFASSTIDRIFLIEHNFENYTVEYDVSGVWTAFTGVVGLDGSGSGISETTYARGSSYYEFNSVTTTAIRISVTVSQTTDAEKFLNRAVVTSELGTLQGYPEIKNLQIDRNARSPKMLSGRSIVLKSAESFSVKLDFKDYPPSLSADIDLMYTLFDRDSNFMVWLCGGLFSTSSDFRYVLRGFRLQDLYTVQIPKSFTNTYRKNVYTSMINIDVDLEETVD